MKKTLLTLITSLLLMPFARAQIPYSDCHIIFQDNFNYYTTENDSFYYGSYYQYHYNIPKRWWKDNYWAPSGGINGTIYKPEQVTIPAFGTIRLTEDTVSPYKDYTFGDTGRIIDHKSGMLCTNNYFRSYGIFEINAQVSKNAWPSFWMIGNSNDGAATEVDIFDDSNGGDTLWFHGYVDWAHNVYRGWPTGALISVPNSRLLLRDLSSAFHKYTCVWTPTTISFYLDDTLMDTHAYTSVETADCAFQVFIQVQTLPSTPGGEYMDVDYIRIWSPNCHDSELHLENILADSSGLNFIPPGMYKYGTILSGASAADSLSMPKTVQNSATILEGPSTTILPNFIADESTYNITPFYDIYNDSNYSLHTAGFFEIVPNNCDNTPDTAFTTPGIRLPPQIGPHPDTSKNRTFGNVLNHFPEIQVYPNPTQDDITISYPCNTTGQLEISITDVSGRVRYSESVSSLPGNTIQQTIDLSAFMPGVYFIRLTLNDQNTVKKIVKL